MNITPGTEIGGYVVGALIGEGGMGCVYEAFATGGSAFAIKVLLPEYGRDAAYRQRFEREAEIMRMLQHPNIVPIHAVGQEGDMMYLVMNLIKGRTLHNAMKQRHISPTDAWIVIEPMASALDHAHQHHVIHRDIKPGNILMQTRPTHVYLSDFGLGRAEELPGLTRSGVRLGTPDYMSPEQVLGKPVSPETDLYSLSVVVYEMLLGRLPFIAKLQHEVVLRHVQALPPRPTSLSPDFPLTLEAVILRGLAKNPKDRYASVGEFAAAYQTALHELSPEAATADYWVQNLPES